MSDEHARKMKKLASGERSKISSPPEQHDVDSQTVATNKRNRLSQDDAGDLMLDTNLERNTQGSNNGMNAASTLEPDSGIFLSHVSSLNQESNVMMPAPLASPQTPRPTHASLALHESALAAAQIAPKPRSRDDMSSSRAHIGAANTDADDTSGLAPRAHGPLNGAKESQYSLTGKAGRRLAPTYVRSWLERDNYGMTDEELDDVHNAGLERFRAASGGGLNERDE